MGICCCTPGVMVPPAGLKFAPSSLLADQSIFPVDFASSVKVTVHGPDAPQVFESNPLVLADQIKVVVGGSDGDGDVDVDVVAVGSGEVTRMGLELHGTRTALAPPVTVNL